MATPSTVANISAAETQNVRTTTAVVEENVFEFVAKVHARPLQNVRPLITSPDVLALKATEEMELVHALKSRLFKDQIPKSSPTILVASTHVEQTPSADLAQTSKELSAAVLRDT